MTENERMAEFKEVFYYELGSDLYDLDRTSIDVELQRIDNEILSALTDATRGVLAVALATALRNTIEMNSEDVISPASEGVWRSAAQAVGKNLALRRGAFEKVSDNERRIMMAGCPWC